MKVLHTLRPTKNQLTVMAMIIAFQDHPVKASSMISSNVNLVAARNMLMKLRAIIFTDNKAELTDVGLRIAKEQNIIDDSGQLTDDGNQLLPDNQTSVSSSDLPNGELTDTTGLDAMPDSPSPHLESFSILFKQLILS
ncbi:MAG: hypothetical protein ACXW2E_00340 [Nitrososphaeraceae archaeon]